MNLQKDINASGDVAGRDVNKTQHIVVQDKKTRLQGLVEQLRNSTEKQSEASEFVDQLQRWMQPKDTVVTRTLEDKLKACSREDLIEIALDAKEIFAMQLTKTTFNPSIQEIYAHILGKIWFEFKLNAKPEEIESKIKEMAEELMSELAEVPIHSNLGINHPEILGMLFYLTGNCHLNWD
jgi:hypothetical protein